MHWVFNGCMTDDWFGAYGALEVGISDAGIFDKHLGFLTRFVLGYCMSDLDRSRLRGVTGTHEECEEIPEEGLGRFSLDI